MRHLSVTSFLLAATLLSSTAAQAGSCALPDEQAGLGMRVLQTQLMVGALSCGQQKQYNSFVKKFRGVLQSKSEDMQSYFRRAGGGVAQQDRFVTRLANQISRDNTPENQREFCSEIRALFNDTQSMRPQELAELAQENRFASRHGIDGCQRMARAE